MASSPPEIIQWIIDTRSLWPEATETRDLEKSPGASRALDLLPPEERRAVLKYVFVRDAKMSLASHLLKHYVVARCCPAVPWHETTITRDQRTKPVFVDPATGRQPVAFNVSHQAGLVAMIAVAGYPDDGGSVDTGVDVVCVSERRARDHQMVHEDERGWARFVDLHADVFSPREAAYLKYSVLDSRDPPFPRGTPREEITDYRLRCFYTLWCLREAYVKMTGEALLADWLSELEFRNFRPPPRPAPVADIEDLGGGGGSLGSGEHPPAVTEHEIWFKGLRVDDAHVCLRSLGPDYMTCTAVRTPERKEVGLGFELGPFSILTVDEIVQFAQSRP